MIQPNLPLEPGAIMQLNPDPAITGNPMFCGCMFVVTEPKSFGAQGFVQGLGEDGKPTGQAYYRACWPEMEPTGGTAVWMPACEADETETIKSAATSTAEQLRELEVGIERNTEKIRQMSRDLKK